MQAELDAIRFRDPAADGRFYYAVSTTGIYCNPSCKARPALPHNITIHATRADAERAGFRPCKRCRPDLPPLAVREAAVVAAACRQIEQAEAIPALDSLAEAAGLRPQRFHRLFRRVAGITPRAYAATCRQARVQAGLAGGAPVTQALYESGFNSAGRFYAAAPGMLGMVPGRYRDGGAGETIRHAMGHSTLGAVLVAATARGVCAILLGDAALPLQADLRRRFPRATLVAGGADFTALVAAVVAQVDQPAIASPDLPLDIRGTAFQRLVWDALAAIPPGQTLTYKALATRLGQPGGARAVAGACAANALAVIVPCHRVVDSKGGLAGYRWGIARKRRLLDQESG